MTNGDRTSEVLALLDLQLDECTRSRVSGSVAADELVARGQVRLQNSVGETPSI